jgi:hypothetical protein
MKKFRCPGRVVRSRKAQAESQLNWIFILIVGAIILAFFTFIVIKQKAASEAKFAGKVSQQLNTILVGAKVSSGSVQDIPTPDLSIRFTCNDYYIGPASQRLGNRVVFAPEFVVGNRLFTWTLDWNVPFKVASLLYITTPSVRYIIISKDANDRAARKIFEALPQKLTKSIFSLADYNAGLIRDEGDTYVRFIFVDSGQLFNIPQEFDGVEVSGLAVDTQNSSVQFLERSVSDEGSFTTMGIKYQYLENELLYGAIFADRHDEYACLAERAYSRLNMVSRVYYERLNAIAPSKSGTACEGYYVENPGIGDLKQATSAYPPDYVKIGDAKSRLREDNDYLQLYSCPLIY